MINEVGKINRDITSKYNYKIGLFPQKLVSILSSKNIESGNNSVQFKQFLKLCYRNCKILMKSINEIKINIKNSGLISEKQLYFTDNSENQY